MKNEIDSCQRKILETIQANVSKSVAQKTDRKFNVAKSIKLMTA